MDTTTNEPGRDEPGREEPGRDEPGRDEPGRDEPGRDEPSRDRPSPDPGPNGAGHAQGATGGTSAGVAIAGSGRSPVDDGGLRRLSPSRASDFKVCPQLFKFRTIDRLPEPTSVYQARGTTAHLALERLYELPPSERTPERLYDLFREAWSELRGTDEFAALFDDPDDERRWGIESLQILANYFALEDPRQVDPLDRERDMLVDLDGIRIRGILDRIDEGPDGELIITDYKTGKAPPETYALPAFFALKIYALLIRQELGRTPRELRLLYLGDSTLYRLRVDDRQLDAMERQLRALWGAIERALERGHFPPRPSRLCDWCSFQSICPAFATDIATGDPSESVPRTASVPATAAAKPVSGAA